VLIDMRDVGVQATGTTGRDPGAGDVDPDRRVPVRGRGFQKLTTATSDVEQPRRRWDARHEAAIERRLDMPAKPRVAPEAGVVALIQLLDLPDIELVDGHELVLTRRAPPQLEPDGSGEIAVR
jgi:hypothetical protein